MDLGHFLRRALIALPFAVVITLGALAYVIFVGQYSPSLTCSAALQQSGLSDPRFATFNALMQTTCTQQLEDLKKSNPGAYKCGSHCVVDAKTREQYDACFAKCPGFADPLASKSTP